MTTIPGDDDDPRGASRYEGESGQWAPAPDPATRREGPPPPQALSSYSPYAYADAPHPTQYGYQPAHAIAPPTNTLATAGGVCGIVAASISWIPLINVFSLVLSIIAVALGAVGWKRANTLQRDVGRPIGRGMAITGVVIGAVGLALALIFIVALGSALNDLSHVTPTPGA